MNHDDEEPLFTSLDAMCEYLGWSDELKEKIRRDMEATAPDRASKRRHLRAIPTAKIDD